MGFLYDLISRNKDKKRCMSCGCNMEPDSEFDICECCLDDLLESDPYEEVDTF